MANDANPLDHIQALMDALDDYVELDGDIAQDERSMAFNWGKKGHGFGMLVFGYDADGVLRCSNETMSRAFCKSVIGYYLDHLQPGSCLPPLLARFQSVDALLDAAVPYQRPKDWPEVK